MRVLNKMLMMTTLSLHACRVNSVGRYSYSREGPPVPHIFLNRALLRLNPALWRLYVIAVHMSVRPKHCSVVNCTVQSTLQIKNISIDPTINGHRPVQRVRLCTTVAWIRRGHAHVDHSARVDSWSTPLCHWLLTTVTCFVVLAALHFALESGAERLSFLVARST